MPQNRQKYTVQVTKTSQVVAKGVGLFHMILGTVFALVGLSILPVVGLFGLPFLLGGIFFAVNGFRVAANYGGDKKGAAKGDDPAAYPADLKFNAPQRPASAKTGERPKARPAAGAAAFKHSRDAAPEEENHDHIRSMARTPEGRLEQLKTLKGAGLYTEEEYRQKRAEILSGK